MTTRQKYMIASVTSALLTAGTVCMWKPTEYTVWNQVFVIATFVLGLITVFLIAMAYNPKLNIPAEIFDFITKL